MTANYSQWTDERTARLKQLWRNGATASEIAADLGGLTRNAVCGKIDRLGLSGARRAEKIRASRTSDIPSVSPVQSKEPVQVGIGAQVAAINRLKQRFTSPAIKPEPFVVQSVDLVPLHIPFSEINDSVCKFECSGQDVASLFTFCGHPSIEGKPYCAEHCRISGAGYRYGASAFGSDEHRRKLSEAQKARPAARRSAA